MKVNCRFIILVRNRFTGMREGETLGLLWDCVDFGNGILKIDKQLQLIRGSRGQYQMFPTKNSKSRTITLAPSVVKILRTVKHKQLENKMLYGAVFQSRERIRENMRETGKLIL